MKQVSNETLPLQSLTFFDGWREKKPPDVMQKYLRILAFPYLKTPLAGECERFILDL